MPIVRFTKEEFEKLVKSDPALEGPMTLAARAALPQTRATFGPMEAALGAAALALLWPVASYVVSAIALPWAYEAKRSSELWRHKFHRWIDDQYEQHGFDPDEAEAAGEELRRQLVTITDPGAQASWERFQEMLKQGDSA